MHTHLHRTPQPNTFPSFTSKNTPRMVREPHRTHGNKTRISRFTDSRITICALCHTPTPISIPSPLVFRCYFHTVVQNKHLPQRASTLVIRATALPQALVCHTHTVYYPTPLPRSSVSRVSLSCSPCDRNSGYTPRARPRALTVHRLPAVGSPHTCFPGRTYGCP